MGNLVYPTLPGLTFGQSKQPEWKTNIHKAVSGKEFRSAWMSAPLYTFRLQYEFLRDAAAIAELQQLVAFYNSVQGSFDSFLHSDPADNSVTAQQFGTGNGTQTAFQLVRSYGGNTEAVGNPFLGGATPELVTNGTFDTGISGWSSMYALAGSAIAWDSVNLQLSITNNGNWAGAASSVINTVPGKVYKVSFTVNTGTSTPGNAATVILNKGYAPGVGGYYSQLFFSAGTDTPTVVYITADAATLYILAAIAPIVGGVLKIDNISVKEVDTPRVYLNGALQTSNYSISSTGLVTFTTPPANAAVLTWSGSYYYRCRFLQDSMEFNKFLSGLWEAKKVEFIGSLSPNRI